jgi:hypothetical protein
MNWKGFGRKRSRLNFKVLFRHSHGGTEENHEQVNQDSGSPGPKCETGASRNEAGVLTARPRRSISFCRMSCKTICVKERMNTLL